MEKQLLEPIKQYNSELKHKIAQNTEAYFDALVRQSGVDVGANRATVKTLRATEAKHAEASKRANSAQGVKVFCIILAVFAFIAAVAVIVVAVTGGTLPTWVTALVSALCFALGIGLIVLLVTKINKVLEHRRAIVAELDAKINELRTEAFNQLIPLNALYDYGSVADIINKTTPLIEFDRNFDVRRLDFMNGKYGYANEDGDVYSSVKFMQSGSVVGNPFVLSRRRVHRMGTRVYMGSRVVTWTETVTDSEGHSRTVTQSQTLTATVTKPYPEYNDYTELIYGNEAAPDLSFSRRSSGASNMSEKQIERTVKKGEKKLRKKAQADMTDDDPTTNFTQMANSEFDVLFGAIDRDNEVQFRLLFTPLAQQNMTALIKAKEPFGDDFSFVKRGMLNYISSAHSQGFPFDAHPSQFVGYDIDESKRLFCAYHNDYFKAFYFDFAPLLSVPLYQQHKPQEYIYKREYPSNCTSYEAELMANAIGDGAFVANDTATNAILKAKFLGRAGKADRVVVSAYSYTAEPRVDFVPVFCRNGGVYDVAVHWTEYIPVERHSVMGIAELDESGPQFTKKRGSGRLGEFLNKYGGRGTAFRHGLLAFVPELESTPELEADWASVLKSK